MFTRVRIVCVAPAPTPSPDGRFPVINGLVADITNVRVWAVRDDGTEEEMRNVVGVSFRVDPGEPAIATVEYYQPSVEVEAVLETEE